MDVNLNPDGTFSSIQFDFDALIALLIIAIPVCFVWWRILRKRAKPEEPKKLHVALATLITTPIVYVMIVALLYLIFVQLIDQL